MSRQAKAICISHIKDVDGCVCAALVRFATGSRVILSNYGNLNDTLQKIGDKYTFVYICDLGINPKTLKELSRITEFAQLIYIDHHYLDQALFNELEEMDIKIIHDLRDCAGALTYKLFHKTLPHEAGLLASYAAISDRLERGPIAKKLLKKYDRDFVLFEAMLLSYALENANVSFKKRIVQRLSKLDYPHQIKNLYKLALEQAKKIGELRKELPYKVTKREDIAYMEAKGGSPGVTANLMLDLCDVSVGISYNTDPQRQFSDISLRGRSDLKIDLGKITSILAEKSGGFGGGHSKASGARIPALNLKEFIYALADHIKKIK